LPRISSRDHERGITVGLLDKILRAGEGRAVKELAKIAVSVNQFESKVSALSDDQLKNQTEIFKERIFRLSFA
jgi:preprotein translocase subunit SecA